MGFIQAVKGAISGIFADQWLDFYGPKQNVSATAGLFPGVQLGKDNERNANTKGNENIITNGTKVIVPEGTALVTIQDGAVTNIIAEPGAYEFKSDDVNSKSIFAGDGLISSIITSSFEKFKYGGIPAAEQLLFYVNLKEIPNNRFGTQSEVYWDDAYFGTQVGARTRGTYVLKIEDPIIFIKNFVPVKYLGKNAKEFDFSDFDHNPAVEQLFNEVVGSLSAAFSRYTNDPERENRMSKIQSDNLIFSGTLAGVVEEAYHWRELRGLKIVQTTILGVEYDEFTRKLIQDVMKADALSGSRGNSFLQQATARGLEAAGSNGGGLNMGMIGMGANMTGNMMSNMQQPNTESSYKKSLDKQNNLNAEENNQAGNQQTQAGNQQVDVAGKLIEMKKLLDAEIITQEEFNKIKSELLGL